MATCSNVRRGLIVFLLIASLLAAREPGAATPDPCGGIGAQISHGEILWTENAIVVQGTAAPNLSDPNKPIAAIKREAQRAATLDAYRKVAEILAGVHVTSVTLAADRPEVVSKIQAYVRNPQVCQTKYYADGGVDIVVKVPLAGELLRALLPTAGTRVAASKSAFSGLIVDASRLAFTPAIAPRFLAPDGRVLFSQENVKMDVLTRDGAVRYVNQAKDVPREWIGPRPLTVEAAALGSLSPCDLVLDQKHSAELEKAPTYLGDGKVVIITAPIRPIECKDLFATVTDSRIDWERKLVLARGFGKVNFSGREDQSVRLRMLERAAEVDAQRKLLDRLLALKIDGERTLAGTSAAEHLLEGVVRNAVRCGAKFYRDGTAEIVMAAPIDGLSARAGQLGRPTPSPRPVVPDSGPTGLIVDTAGLPFEPVLAPVLSTAEGDIIYNHASAASAWIQAHGVVGYRTSVAEAKSDARVGRHPVIVRAQKYEPGSHHLILAPIDDATLGRLKQMTGAFSQGRVVIVTSAATGQ